MRRRCRRLRQRHGDLGRRTPALTLTWKPWTPLRQPALRWRLWRAAARQWLSARLRWGAGRLLSPPRLRVLRPSGALCASAPRRCAAVATLFACIGCDIFPQCFSAAVIIVRHQNDMPAANVEEMAHSAEEARGANEQSPHA